MISGAYLRQQAKILIAMSRVTLDLGMAGRLRKMASELQARAAEQEDTRAAEQEDKTRLYDNELLFPSATEQRCGDLQADN